MSVVQLPLVMRDRDRASLAAVRVREELKAVADKIGRKQLGDEWGCSETSVNGKLGDIGRHRIHLEEVVDLIIRDRDLRVLAELNELSGCEAPERKRVLDPGEKLQRIEEAAGELFGPDVLELLRRKAGL
jgi:hypothetical protein